MKDLEYKGYYIKVFKINEEIKCIIYSNKDLTNKVDEFMTIGNIDSAELKEKIENYIDEVI